MVVSEVADKLGLRILARGSDSPVSGGYVADLLSDVIANAAEGCIWITVQQHLNVIAVAQLKKVAAILIPHGSLPDAKVIERAGTEGIFLLQGDAGAFELCGRLFNLLGSSN
jgi:hypothetical protein